VQVVLEVFVSVLAQGSTGDTFRVLVQGALLTSANAHSLLATLKKQLKHLETDIAHIYLNTYPPPRLAAGPPSVHANATTRTRIRTIQRPQLATPDLRVALQNGVFALTLLPHDASPGLIRTHQPSLLCNQHDR
jgi:hypothetical protein